MTGGYSIRQDYYTPTLKEIVPGVDLYLKDGMGGYIVCTLETEEDVAWAMENFMNISVINGDLSTKTYTVGDSIKLKK